MTSIFHLEQYKILREAVAKFLEGEEGIQLTSVSKATEITGTDILKAADILLLADDADFELNNTLPDRIRLCEELCSRYPDMSVILHTKYNYGGWIPKFSRAGVKGFVSKYSGFVELREAIQSVERGITYMCPVIKSLVLPLSLRKRDRVGPAMFSSREEEVLSLIAKGYSTKEIASALFVSVKTVETHRQHIIEKARVKNSAELVKYASVCGYC